MGVRDTFRFDHDTYIFQHSAMPTRVLLKKHHAKTRALAGFHAGIGLSTASAICSGGLSLAGTAYSARQLKVVWEQDKILKRILIERGVRGGLVRRKDNVDDEKATRDMIEESEETKGEGEAEDDVYDYIEKIPKGKTEEVTMDKKQKKEKKKIEKAEAKAKAKGDRLAAKEKEAAERALSKTNGIDVRARKRDVWGGACVGVVAFGVGQEISNCLDDSFHYVVDTSLVHGDPVSNAPGVDKAIDALISIQSELAQELTEEGTNKAAEVMLENEEEGRSCYNPGVNVENKSFTPSSNSPVTSYPVSSGLSQKPSASESSDNGILARPFRPTSPTATSFRKPVTYRHESEMSIATTATTSTMDSGYSGRSWTRNGSFSSRSSSLFSSESRLSPLASPLTINEELVEPKYLVPVPPSGLPPSRNSSLPPSYRETQYGLDDGGELKLALELSQIEFERSSQRYPLSW